jgi:hypothetical protein
MINTKDWRAANAGCRMDLRTVVPEKVEDIDS